MTKRVLLISPYFPPHNVIGTKRAINFVQGVHGFDDWEVIVLASKPFNNNLDDKLNEQIPESVVVNYGFVGLFRGLIKFLDGGFKSKRPKKVEPKKIKEKQSSKSKKKKSSLTPFDQYLWDIGSGYRNGRKLIKKYKPDVIWVNADPWSGFLVANKLSRKFGIPWVADLRDPWTIFEKKMELRPKITANTIKRYERNFFETASKVVLNSETACEAYKKSYSDLPSEKFTFIRNAYNKKLLNEGKPKQVADKFIFGYFGGFRQFVPSNFILKGFADFIKKNNLTPNEVCFEVRGSLYADFHDQVEECGLKEFVVIGKEVTQDEAVSLLRSWDVLMLSAISDFKWMISGKFYDYLFIRKPILAVSDNEELNRLIEETESGDWANTADTEKIVSLYEKYFRLGKTDLLNNELLIEPFGIEAQGASFRKVLKEIKKH